MIFAAFFITLLYLPAMLFLLLGFSRVPKFCGKNPVPKTAFSIVIPYRNEAENLPSLFTSLLKLKYPAKMFEIIAVNDASEDNSEALWQDFRSKNAQLQINLLQNVRKSGSPKKDAIKTAIQVAKKDFIITTDADCEVRELWLQHFDAIITRNRVDVVAGPVSLKDGVSKMAFLRGFQELDFFSLQAATIGGFGINNPFLCNGANFCYSKMAFLKVNGFEGNDGIASGDDIFLLEKFQKNGFKTAFLKSLDATVFTNSAASWQQLFFQRVRWAAKTSAYKGLFSKTLGVLVFAMNFMLVILIPAGLLAVVPPVLVLIIFLCKLGVDSLLIYSSAKFFKRKSLMKTIILSSLFYPFFSSAVVIYSVFLGYQWKGRHFKK